MKYSIIIAFIFFTLNAHCQIDIDINYNNTGQISETEAVIRAKAFTGGVPFELTKKNVLIQEGNIVTYAKSIEKNESWYDIVFESNIWRLNPDDFIVDANLWVMNDGKYASKQIMMFVMTPYLKTTDIDFNPIEELEFGIVPPGNKKQRQVKVILNGTENAKKIDSITFGNEKFSYNWQGSEFDMRPLPVSVLAGFGYLIDVFFQSDDEEYQQDYMTIHFDGYREQKFLLKANEFSIETVPQIKLLSPNGGNKYVPCQTDSIFWEGHSPDLPVKIELSTDSGNSWKTVTSVKGSSYEWTVPDLPSENALIRISQPFQSDTDYILEDDYYNTTNLAFDSLSTKLLSANDGAKVVEWRLLPGQEPFVLNRYFVQEDEPNNYVKPLGVEYINQEQNIAFAYVEEENNEETSYIAIFDIGQSAPSEVKELPYEFDAKKMIINRPKEMFAFLPENSTDILLTDLTGNYRKYINFEYPIQDAAFNANGDSLYVAMLSGEIEIYSLANYPSTPKIGEFSIPNRPIISSISVAPNGFMLAIGLVPKVVGAENEIILYDLNRDIILKNFATASSNPIGLQFNPSSSNLVVGSEQIDQIVVADLSVNQQNILDGHRYTLTDIKLSPDGHGLASCATGRQGLKYRTFAYVEKDQSDDFFNIIRPEIQITSAQYAPVFIGTENPKTINKVIENIGEVPFIIEYFEYFDGSYFDISGLNEPDTLLPGESRNIDIIFNPLDTGMIRDTLFIYNCGNRYDIPLEGYSKNRSIAKLADGQNFGELCIGDTLVQEIALLRNDDPINLEINSILIEGLQEHFTIVDNILDTVLAPGQTLYVSVRFTPKSSGEIHSNVKIFHSGQENVIPILLFNGFGISASITVSHDPLQFIPEIPERDLQINNTGNMDLTITDANVEPSGYYEITSGIPTPLQSGGNATIGIKQIKQHTGFYELTLNATPCKVIETYKVGAYDASSIVKAEDVWANPRSTADIPITFETSHNYSYNGIRTFECEIVMHPWIFFPESVSSGFGDAEIIRNEVVNDKRYIRIKVNGDFTRTGTAAIIHGVAGLTDVDSTNIDFSDDALYWSSIISTSKISGTFRLTGTCPGRGILKDQSNVSIISIAPNPAKEIITLLFDSAEDGMYSLQVFDVLGQKILSTEGINMKRGANEITINVEDLKPGTYRVVVKTASSVDSSNLIIMK